MNDTYVLLMPPFLLIVNQFNFEEIVTANKSKCTFHDDRISLKGISNKSKKCKRVEEIREVPSRLYFLTPEIMHQWKIDRSSLRR